MTQLSRAFLFLSTRRASGLCHAGGIGGLYSVRQPAQALSPQVTTLSGYKNRSFQPATTGKTLAPPYVSSHARTRSP